MRHVNFPGSKNFYIFSNNPVNDIIQEDYFMPVKLIITRKDDPNWQLEKEFYQEEITMGRSKASVLHLEDEQKVISRNHARIKLDGDTYYLVDCESANYTYLDDKRLPANQPHPLEDGASIRIGMYEIRFYTLAETNESTMLFENPFLEDSAKLQELLCAIQEKYEQEEPALRQQDLARALEQNIQHVENEELKTALQKALGLNGAGETEKKSPEKNRRNPDNLTFAIQVGKVLDLFIQSFLRIIQEAAEFRKEFVGIALSELPTSLYTMNKDQVKDFLLDPALSEEEMENRLKTVEMQVDELLTHQSALLDGYRACVREGAVKLLKTLDISQLENHIGKDHFSLGPLKIPYKWIPFYVSRKTHQVIIQIYQDLLADGAVKADLNFLRPAFVDAYMKNQVDAQEGLSASKLF